MFRAKTVLVLGAGASCEVGLPQGADLLKTIAQLLEYRFEYGQTPTNGDLVVFQALRRRLDEGKEVLKINEHLNAGRQIIASASQAMSIDNIIDMLEDERAEVIGKLAISRSILMAENNSQYFQPPSNWENGITVANFDKTWYSRFTKLLVEGVRKSTVKNIFDNLEIVNFNYDRCLEHYLVHSLASYFGGPIEDMQPIVDTLKIHRPYGRVGRLPWQRGIDPAIGFGRGNAEEVDESAKQLRTFTEQLQEGQSLDEMRTSIAAADRIVFLGFAFHRQNVKLLSVQRSSAPEVIATAFGISRNDQGVIQSELGKAFSLEFTEYSRFDLEDRTCAGLFDENWRTLTALPDG